MSFRFALALASVVSAVSSATAYETGRVDGHAPIGVMGDHTHHAGEWMTSYRYMRMSMKGNRDGSARKSSADVLRNFPVTPTSMDMEMHMFGVMYAPTDQLTLTAMVPFLRLDMNHKTRMGAKFTTRSKGIGDIAVGGLWKLFENEVHHLHANTRLSFPTGSISEKDDTPMGRVRLPYPMQLGSGTFDPSAGLTYSGQGGAYSWGGQALGTYRFGNNRNGYRLGHEYEASAWGARRLASWLSTSLRLAWQQWGDIRGDDDDLVKTLVPTADPDLRAGKRLDALVGLNLAAGKGILKGQRLALEAGWPVYQSLDGPQLEVDWQLTLGWQFAF